MGQSPSSETPGSTSSRSYSKEKLFALFQIRALSLLTKTERATVSSKLNMKDVIDMDAVLTFSDLKHLLGFSKPDSESHDAKSDDFVSNESDDLALTSLDDAITVLQRSFTILGRLPFLAKAEKHPEQLTLRKLIVSVLALLGRFSRLSDEMDHLKLFYISLAMKPLDSSDYSKELETEKPIPEEDEIKKKYESECSYSSKMEVTDADKKCSVKVLSIPDASEEDATLLSKRIVWNTLDPLKTYDGITMDTIKVSAQELLSVLSLFLLVNSVPSKSHKKMQEDIYRLARTKWSAFETAAMSLLRYINVDIIESNLATSVISYMDFAFAMRNALEGFLTQCYTKLIRNSLFSSASIVVENSKNINNTAGTFKSEITFTSTRLVNEATISQLALFMSSISSDVKITPQNLVELYNGSQSGFSIRSLESKIFKWRAPTIFLVSGKRVRNKTIVKNKRYQQFDSEFPRFFRSNEDPKRSWQSDHDKITYAVFVNQPWQNSNKNNFGDEKTAIMAISPRFDIFESRLGSLAQGKSIYFNNQGMGLGFGNDQPINKHNVRKYLPGGVSLTIEANLEFAIFRHVVGSGANVSNYFSKSNQRVICEESYEDRFTITDLEVWGVGSTKELEEQKKQWEWEEKQAQARQSVNLHSIGEERALLEMAGIIGKHGSGGSV